MNPFNSLLQMMDTLHTEDDCRQYLEDMRWHGEPICPHCGSISNGSVSVIKIEFGNNIFVGVSQYNGAGYCPNSNYLETFYKTSLNSSMKWNDVTFGNGKFVILSISGYVSTSADGKNWTTPEQIKDESGNVVTATLNGVCAMP